jgi:hypothetical protein
MMLTRRGWVLIAASAGLLGWWAPDAPRLVGDLTGSSFPQALLALGTLVTLVLAGWVVAIALLVAAGASSRVVGLITPRLLRHALLAGAASALVLGPAHAERGAGTDTGLRHTVSGLPLPDRPDTSPPRARTTPNEPIPAAEPAEPVAPLPVAEPSDAVVVRPGDTLWAIAARSLPRDASDAQIAAATRAWHDANRQVVGPDPHLIFPAQRLVPPTGKDHP